VKFRVTVAFELDADSEINACQSMESILDKTPGPPELTVTLIDVKQVGPVIHHVLVSECTGDLQERFG